VSRARLALTAGAVAILGVLVLRATSPGASARPAEPAPPRLRPAASAPRAALGPSAVPSRDVFAYEGRPLEREALDQDPPRMPVATPLPAPPSLAEPAAVDPLAPRLIGLVRRGGQLQAVLAVDGEVTVVKKGDRAGAYSVVWIDEDSGVRLQDASGTGVTLQPPPP